VGKVAAENTVISFLLFSSMEVRNSGIFVLIVSVNEYLRTKEILLASTIRMQAIGFHEVNRTENMYTMQRAEINTMTLVSITTFRW